MCLVTHDNHDFPYNNNEKLYLCQEILNKLAFFVYFFFCLAGLLAAAGGPQKKGIARLKGGK